MDNLQHWIDLLLEQRCDLDHEKITHAVELAIDAHAGQYRQEGEPYVHHPLRVAVGILPAETDLVLAAILHDVVEDTHVTLATLVNQFGEDVGFLVNGLTKNPKPAPPYDHFEYERKNHAKLLQFLKERPDLLRVKLSDRIDNMGSVQVFRHSKIARYIHEVRTFYIPTGFEWGQDLLAGKLEEITNNKASEYLDE